MIDPLLSLVILLASGVTQSPGAPRCFDVHDYGATGDGKTLDTDAINKAIEICSSAGGGTVCFPAGIYLSTTVHLRSNVTLYIDSGAVLKGCEDSSDYDVVETSYVNRPWSQRQEEICSFILGNGVSNVAIMGSGVVDGSKAFNKPRFADKVKVPRADQLPGWRSGELNRGPHTIAFYNSRSITVRDITIRDSANYAFRIRGSENINIDGVRVEAGWDGINVHGSRFMTVSNCHLQTGDDAVAGLNNEHIVFSNCLINSSINAFRLMVGNRHILINNCIFYGPGVFEHRTSRTTHMTGGFVIRPFGKPELSPEHTTDDIMISNVSMVNVRKPFDIGIYGDASIRNIRIHNVQIHNAGREPIVIEGAESVTVSDLSLVSEGGSPPGQSAYSFSCRNVRDLELRNVTVGFDKKDVRPALACWNVQNLRLNGFRAEWTPDTDPVLLLENIGKLSIHNLEDIPIVSPVVERITSDFSTTRGRAIVDEPFAVVVHVKNEEQEGLGEVNLNMNGETFTRWIWLKEGQSKEVRFENLKADAIGPVQLESDSVAATVTVEPRPGSPDFVYNVLLVKPVTIGTLRAYVSIHNIGGEKGVEKVELRVDGEIVSAEEVTLAPGESTIVELSCPLDEAGVHRIAIGDCAPKETHVPGVVKPPYHAASELGEGRCFQFGDDNHFYLYGAQKRPRMDDERFYIADEYVAVYLKDALRESNTVTVRVDNPERYGGWGPVGIVVRNDVANAFSPGYLVLAISSKGWFLQWDADGDGILDEHTPFYGYTDQAFTKSLSRSDAIWPNWLKLVRKGNTYIGYYRTEDSDWEKIGEVDVSSAEKVQDVGMFAAGIPGEFWDFTVDE